jgi:integrase
MRAAKRHASKELSKIRFFTPDESRTFVDAVRGDRFEALCVLAFTSGMRQGEMLGLQWPDVDLENGKITIFRALHRTKRRRVAKARFQVVKPVARHGAVKSWGPV